MLKALLILLLAGSADAVSFRKEDGKILMRATCEEANDVISTLATWSKNADTGKTCNGSFLKEESPGNCRYDVTSCVPAHVVQYQGTTSALDDPNCWNLALVMKGILPAFRFTTHEEMNFYMRPPLCRELQGSEKPEPGDVGAIRLELRGKSADPAKNEVHGFIYISDKVVYSKNGNTTKSSYELQDFDPVARLYDAMAAKACQQNKSTPGCNNTTTYFRCDSMDEYLQKNPQLPHDLLAAMKKMEAAELCLQETVMKKTNLSATADTNLKEVSEILTKYLADQPIQSGNACYKNINGSFNRVSFEVCEGSNGNLEPEERTFILGSLLLRMQAINEQLGYVPEPLQTEEMKSFAATIKKWTLADPKK